MKIVTNYWLNKIRHLKTSPQAVGKIPQAFFSGENVSAAIYRPNIKHVKQPTATSVTDVELRA